MVYGSFSITQQLVLSPYIIGKQIHDLGCGDFELSEKLLDLGASSIIGIDKCPAKLSSPFITTVQTYFHNYHSPIDIAFVSWPVNFSGSGLLRLLKFSNTVIYLGKNTDGISCGSPEIFQHLKNRKILSYSPDPKNTLIIYSNCFVKRALRGEEYAAIFQDKIYSYEESENLINRNVNLNFGGP